MGRTSSLTLEQLETIERMLREGRQRKDIAEEFGLTPQRVSQIARGLDLEMRQTADRCSFEPEARTNINFRAETWQWLQAQPNLSDAVDKCILFWMKNHQPKLPNLPNGNKG